MRTNCKQRERDDVHSEQILQICSAFASVIQSQIGNLKFS